MISGCSAHLRSFRSFPLRNHKRICKSHKLRPVHWLSPEEAVLSPFNKEQLEGGSFRMDRDDTLLIPKSPMDAIDDWDSIV